MTQKQEDKTLEIIRNNYIKTSFAYEFINVEQEDYLKLTHGSNCSLLKIVVLTDTEQTQQPFPSHIELAKKFNCSDVAILTVTFNNSDTPLQHFYNQL